MTWWEGVEEPRLLLAPESCAVGAGAGCLLLLCHPKTGAKTCYLFVDGLILEIHWFKQSHGSWFLGDYVCEDGSLYTATPIDPVFLLLPIFEEARMKKPDSLGMFRELDEILFINDYPGYQEILSIADTCMQVVCEVKEVGSARVFRLNDEKVLAWLCSKVSLLSRSLPALDQNYTAQNEKNTLTDAVSILGEYVKDEPWMKILCNHLNVNLDERTSDSGASQVPKMSGLGSLDPLQEMRCFSRRSGYPFERELPYNFVVVYVLFEVSVAWIILHPTVREEALARIRSEGKSQPFGTKEGYDFQRGRNGLI